MCCEPNNTFGLDQANGECPECGSPTVDGEAIDSCAYSTVECTVCGSAPCDGSC